MYFETTGLSHETNYHLLMQTVIPRPIAWVLSDNGSDLPEERRWNLAPFSMFNAVCAEPPMVLFSIGHGGRTGGAIKDTWINVERREHFVVHLTHWDIARQVVDSSVFLPHGESEVTHCDLALTDFDGWPVPRLAIAKAAFACTREMMVAVGTRPQMMVIGRVHKVFLDESILVTNPEKPGRIIVDPKLYDPLCRLGATNYARLGELQSLRQPGRDSV